MSWRVKIVNDLSIHLTRIYIFEMCGATQAESKVLHMDPSGQYRMDDFEEHENNTPPTLSLDWRSAREVLGGLAEELAHLGYGTPDAGPLARAMEKHIASLEKELDRIERIVKP